MCQGRHQFDGGAKVNKKKGAFSAIGKQVNERTPNASGVHVPYQQCCQDLGNLPPSAPQLSCKQPDQTPLKPPFSDTISKRQLMLAVGVSILSAAGVSGPAARASEISPPERLQERQRKAEKIQKEIGGPNLLVDYTKAGPYDIRTLPTILEHTCANCYPQCVDGEPQLDKHEGPGLTPGLDTITVHHLLSLKTTGSKVTSYFNEVAYMHRSKPIACNWTRLY
jgi:hypothetical protein